MLQVLLGNLQHEISIELNEEVIPNCCLESCNVQGQRLIEQIQLSCTTTGAMKAIICQTR
jgi:hypothetical protein